MELIIKNSNNLIIIIIYLIRKTCQVLIWLLKSITVPPANKTKDDEEVEIKEMSTSLRFHQTFSFNVHFIRRG